MAITGKRWGALSVTAVPLFRDTYAALLRQTAQLPSPDWRNARHGESTEDVALRAVSALENYLIAQHTQTAALIVEPLVQAAGAMAMYHPRFLREARTLCDRYGVHLISCHRMSLKKTTWTCSSELPARSWTA